LVDGLGGAGGRKVNRYVDRIVRLICFPVFVGGVGRDVNGQRMRPICRMDRTAEDAGSRGIGVLMEAAEYPVEIDINVDSGPGSWDPPTR